MAALSYKVSVNLDRRSTMLRLMSSCAAVAVLVGPATAAMDQGSPQDYPQWRGHNRDGAASAFSKPQSWPDALRLRWRVDVGEGYATPIVVGRIVYVFTRRNGKEGISALDADTGGTLWRTDYPVAFEPYEGAEDHGEGPKATPLFHNGRLYTLGISGTISAFDALTGKVAWQKPAPIVQPDVGMAASPIADRDLVIVQEGCDALTAFEANTGRARWSVNNQFSTRRPSSWTCTEPGRSSRPLNSQLSASRRLMARSCGSIPGSRRTFKPSRRSSTVTRSS